MDKRIFFALGMVFFPPLTIGMFILAGDQL